MVDFGEVTRYKCRSHEGTIGKSEFRWEIGVWLGVDTRTGQHILFVASQGGIQHSRTLMRMPDAQKFDLDKLASVTATPWSIHEATQTEGVFADKEAKPQQDQAELAPKKLYISQSDLDTHGYTEGCKKCASILALSR